MMEQYKNETAQIHAPAALIEKTKAAVRQEEERIRREQSAQIPAPAPQVTYEDYASYRKKYSVRKWMYPLTAAAAVVILLSVSMNVKNVLPGGFTGNGAAADGAMEAPAAAEAPAEAPVDEAAADEACAEEITEGIASEEAAAGAVEEMDNGETDSMAEASADSMTQAEAEDMESTGGVMSEAPAADFAKEEADSTKEAARKFRDRKGGSMKIEAVDEKPDFYDSPDAEDIVYEGLTFRVFGEEGEWYAYVEAEDGTACVIRGRAEELDEFLEEAYAELEKVFK